MTRAYNMTKRADQQAETRLRIVEAAIDLHGTVGPARSSFSMVAERAGVQRHTLYAHFPDERSLLMACSSLHLERQPLPDPEPWRAIGDRDERLRTGIGALYDWYARNEALAGCVLRDIEVNEIVREVAGLRIGGPIAACEGVLAAGLGKRQKAMLHLALDFYTWRSLVRASGLKTSAAVETMVLAINGVK
ncbi:MAG: TetR family transcriptional regulator [Hyphomicrobium sp. SCN 65-11]|nr:MAG: TetR family transcriptional regulator [Hyphomicrobium sp. SCN 65-11]